MRRIIATLLSAACALVVAGQANAQIGIRNISSFSVDTYFDGSTSLDINQVVLFPVARWMSGELKLQRQDTPAFDETTVSVAPIFIIGPYNYLILRYGLGIGTGTDTSSTEIGAGSESGEDGVELSHDLTIDANYETARFAANLTLRGSYYPRSGSTRDDDYWFVLPSAGARFFAPSGFGAGARYFFSYNSDGALSNAILADAQYRATQTITVKIGGSGSVTLAYPPGGSGESADARESTWEYSAITGASFQITPALAIRYHLEYLGIQGSGTGNDGLRNLIVLDAKF